MESITAKTDYRKVKDWFCQHQISFEIVFAVMVSCFAFLWSLKEPYNYGPDEGMRYLLPAYMYKHGKMPMADNPEVRHNVWGFSYAYLPFWLEPFAATFFMHVFAFFFGESDYVLLIGARFVSVLCYGGMAFCFARTLNRLFPEHIKWPVLFLIVLMPQVTFLGSYVNQDIVNLFGISMILLSWVQGIKDGWNVKNSILLSTGIVVVVLSYYFGYGWVLGSIFFFFISHLAKMGNNHYSRKMWKLTGLICLIVLGCTSFFLIRNVVLYGDLLGRASMARDQELYAMHDYKPSVHLSIRKQGLGITYLLHDKDWWYKSFVSFVGCFAFMEFDIRDWMIKFYWLVYVVSGMMALISILSSIRTRDRTVIIFALFILFEILLGIFLSYWYSYSTDYQAQGRYMMSILPCLLLICGEGMKTGEKHPAVRSAMIMILVVMISLSSYQNTFLPSLTKVSH